MIKWVLWIIILDGDGLGRAAPIKQYPSVWECMLSASEMNHREGRQPDEVFYCQVEEIV